MTKEQNKQWENFVAETEKAYVSYAIRYTRNLEDAQDVVYSVYGKLCKTDYNFFFMKYVGFTALQRTIFNRHRASKSQKNDMNVVYMEDAGSTGEKPRPLTNFLGDKSVDIEADMALKELGLQDWEPAKPRRKKKECGGWPYVESFIGF